MFTGAGFIATMLDQEMLEVKRGVAISPRHTVDTALPTKTGAEVSKELGSRYLLRYLLRSQVGMYASGSSAPHWVTPTPYSPKELNTYLALPNPVKQRAYVLVLDAELITEIKGPRWVRAGIGIEYFLPKGFTEDAVAFKGVGPTWEIQIR